MIIRYLNTNRRCFVLLLMLASLVQLGASSPRIDSLKAVLNASLLDTIQVKTNAELARSYMTMGELDQAKVHIKQSKSLAKRLDYEEGIAKADLQMGTVLLMNRALDSALYYFHEVINRAKEPPFRSLLSSAYMNSGIVFYELAEHDTATKLVESSLEIEKALGNKDKVLKRYNNLAAIYLTQKDHVNAMKNFLQALDLSNELQDDLARLQVLSNIGRLYYTGREYDKATVYYEQGIEILNSIDNPAFNMTLRLNFAELKLAEKKQREAIDLLEGLLGIRVGIPQFENKRVFVYLALSEAYQSLGILDSALLMAEEGLERAIELKYPLANYNALIALGKVHFELGAFKQAEQVLMEALAMEIQDLGLRAEMFHMLSRINERKGSYADALRFQKSFKVYDDSIKLGESAAEIARIEVRSELEAEQAILNAQKENEKLLLLQEVSRAQAIRNYSIGGLLVALILGFILYRSYERKREDNLVLEEKTQTILAQKEELTAKAELLHESNGRIKELSEFKERLAHMAVHDMKNPLHTVIGLSNEPPIPRNMRIIRKSSLQMLNFITNLLDIYKLENTNISLNLEIVELKEIFDAAENEVSTLLLEKGIVITQNLKPGLRGVFDPTLLIRVLVNLLTNAIKYSDVGSVVKLYAQIKQHNGQREVQIAVEDKGVGIADDMLKNIFESFNPKKPQHITKSASTGIGLNFCKLAIRSHKGRIEVKSEIDKGTCVMINLPLYDSLDELNVEDIQVETPQETGPIVQGERHLITSFAGRLRLYEVHEVGKIIEILKEMDEANIQSPWKNKLQSTVYSGNQDIYDELIFLALEEHEEHE